MSPAYRLVDVATQAYGLTVGGLVLLFHGDAVPDWPLRVAGHLVLAVALHLFLVRTPRKTGSDSGPGDRCAVFLREYYPVLLLPFWFRELGRINRMFVDRFLDPVMLRWEQAWFGGQASVEWMLRWPSVWVAEFFHTAYFSYYLMIGGTALWLLARDRRAFRHFLTVVCLVFYGCYLVYLFVPVMGPRILSQSLLPGEVLLDLDMDLPPEVPAGFGSGPMAAVMRFLYRHFETEGAAFPSSHVVVAIVTLRFTWTYLPRIRLPHALAVVALAASTVYCRYHYVVDVLAALVAAPVLLLGAEWLWRRWGDGAGSQPVGTSRS